MESKKKNMMRRETEAPKGRHIACTLSRVVTLFSRLKKRESEHKNSKSEHKNSKSKHKNSKS